MIALRFVIFALMLSLSFAFAQSATVGSNSLDSRKDSESKVLPPETHWKSKILLPYGKEVNLRFFIVDPRKEGVISTDFERACAEHLVKHYRCSCEKFVGYTKCKMKWFAYDDAPEIINFTYSATNTSSCNKEDSQTQQFEGVINLYRD